jgi:hypothetical protein
MILLELVDEELQLEHLVRVDVVEGDGPLTATVQTCHTILYILTHHKQPAIPYVHTTNST